jgi:hypothetical protein
MKILNVYFKNINSLEGENRIDFDKARKSHNSSYYRQAIPCLFIKRYCVASVKKLFFHKTPTKRL